MTSTEKVAIVTGGRSGIGMAICDRFARDGYRVVAADLSVDTDELNPTADIVPLHVDVADVESVDRMVGLVVQEFGRVDCVVHSAGVGRVEPFLDTTPALFDFVLRTNLYGAFYVGQACAREMVRTGGGTIINIGSVSGLRGNAGRTAYGASKGGLRTMSEIMAVELAVHGIRVNVIAPGPIETPLAATQHDAAVRDGWHRVIPLKRYGKVADVASAAAFLCSDEATFITGAVINVDGGFMAAGILDHQTP